MDAAEKIIEPTSQWRSILILWAILIALFGCFLIGYSRFFSYIEETNPRNYREHALKLLEHGESERALEFCRKVERQFPRKAGVNHLEGLIYGKMGNLQEQLDEFRRASEKNRRFPDWVEEPVERYNLGLEYLKLSQWPLAAIEIEASEKQSPGASFLKLEDIITANARAGRWFVCDRYRLPGQPMPLAEEQTNPQDIFAIGIVYQLDGDWALAQNQQDVAPSDWALAKKQFGLAAQQGLDTGELHLRTGDANEALRDTESARREWQVARKFDNSRGQAAYRLGKLEETAGSVETAIGLYEEALATTPKLIDAYARLADLYSARNETKKVRDVVGRFQSLRPDYPGWSDDLGGFSFAGYDVDGFEFGFGGKFHATSYWIIGSGNPAVQDKIEMRLESSNRRTYAAGRTVVITDTLKQILPNSTFDSDWEGRGYPVGWQNCPYDQDLDPHQIVTNDSGVASGQPGVSATQPVRQAGGKVVLLKNDPSHQHAGVMTDFIDIPSPLASTNNRYFLAAAWMRSTDGKGAVAVRWRGSETTENIFYLNSQPSDGWKHYATLISPRASDKTCSMMLFNAETTESAFFDEVLLAEVSFPKR